jgi:hypothetical protein
MVTLVRTALGIVWALWFGGIMAVFVFAVAFFNGLDRTSATMATGVMFPTFERYTLFLAALALVAAVGWRVAGKSRAAGWTFGLLGVATVMAVISAAVITPKILDMRNHGLTHTPEFGRAHGISGVLYVVESIALLGAGVVLLSAERRPARRDELAAGTTAPQ